MTIKINLSSKIKNVKKSGALDEYIEIDKDYIRIFKNIWLKYTDKQTFITSPGGFLTKIEDDTVYLRNIKGEVVSLYVDDYIFYCKADNEIYLCLKELVIMKEKLQIERSAFNKEKREFYLKTKNT